MRQVTTTVYLYDELSDDAKETARNWFRQADDYPWSSEFRESLEAFCNMAGITLHDWEYDGYSYNYTLRSDHFSEKENGLQGARLWSYVHSCFDGYLIRRKRYSIGKKSRVSNVLSHETECPFTGVCFDEDFLEPIRKLDLSMTYEDVIRACLDSGFSAVVKDIEYFNSDEAVEEFIRRNEYEFTKNGKGLDHENSLYCDLRNSHS